MLKEIASSGGTPLSMTSIWTTYVPDPCSSPGSRLARRVEIESPAGHPTKGIDEGLRQEEVGVGGHELM